MSSLATPGRANLGGPGSFGHLCFRIAEAAWGRLLAPFEKLPGMDVRDSANPVPAHGELNGTLPAHPAVQRMRPRRVHCIEDLAGAGTGH
jgi:hypothetical protein